MNEIWMRVMTSIYCLSSFLGLILIFAGITAGNVKVIKWAVACCVFPAGVLLVVWVRWLMGM